MVKHGMRAAHPGEVLREDYLKPLGIPPVSNLGNFGFAAPSAGAHRVNA